MQNGAKTAFEMKRSAALQWKQPETQHCQKRKKKGKDKQNKGATRITSGMSLKQGMVFDNQQRGCRIACLRPHFGHCLWQWLLNSRPWNLKWHVVCWSTSSFTVSLRLSFSLITAVTLKGWELASLMFLILTANSTEETKPTLNLSRKKNIASFAVRLYCFEFIPPSSLNQQSGVNTEDID